MQSISRLIVSLPTPLNKCHGDIYVGIDCAPRNTGVCLLGRDNAALYGISTEGLRGAARLAYLRDAVSSCLQSPFRGHRDIAMVCIEDGIYADAPGRRFLMGQAHGAVMSAIARYPVLLASNASIKKFFAGISGADKDRMVQQCNEDLRLDLRAKRKPDDDLADAYACALLGYAYHTRDIPGPHRRKRAEVVVSLEHEDPPCPTHVPFTFTEST